MYANVPARAVFPQLIVVLCSLIFMSLTYVMQKLDPSSEGQIHFK